MKKIKINWQSERLKSITIGLVLSLLVLIIPIVGYSIGSQKSVIWPATFVCQIAVALIWGVIKLGVFSSSTSGFSRLGASFRNQKLQKNGVYRDIDKKKKTSLSPVEIEKKSMSKSWLGIITMLVISLPELIVMIITM